MPIKKTQIKQDIQNLNNLLNDKEWHKKINEIELLFKNLNKIVFEKEKIEINEIEISFSKKKKQFFKSLENKRNENLKIKIEIINEIKALIVSNDKTHIIYNKFKKLQKKWYSVGPVPKYENNNLWETYKHHIERFYNFLHLNRELREKDFQHNYNEKIKIIEKTELLAKDAEKDIHKSIRELNNLHRLWKNELGPVEKKHSDELWKRFQKSSKMVHSKKNIAYKKREELFEDNLNKKNKIIERLNQISIEVDFNFSNIKKIINEINELKNQFQSIGRTPKDINKKIWSNFRLSLKEINNKKNIFYKTRKKEINDNINFKKELINQIKFIIEENDIQKNINVVKNIQKKWKESKGIPKKISDKLWEEFKKVCGDFFDNIKSKENFDSIKDREKINELNEYVNKIKIPKKITKESEYLELISEFIDNSKKITSDYDRLKIKTNEKLLDVFFKIINQTNLSFSIKEKMRFDVKLLIIMNSEPQINSTKSDLNIEKNKIKNELIQLENNLHFFSKSSEKNPMYIKVNKKIISLNKEILIIEEKIKLINDCFNKNFANKNKKEIPIND